MNETILERVDRVAQEAGKADLSHEDKVKLSFPEEYATWGQDLKPLDEIERSLQKKFRNATTSKFTKAIRDYELFKEGDKIGVAISGGKDSLLAAKLFQAIQKYGDFDFELEFFCMDPGYAEVNRKLMEFNLAWLGIPARIFDSNIFAVSESSKGKPCYLCARMRRGFLYAKAQEMGCTKLALGHHFNDVIETTLLNVLWSGNYKIMMPKLVSTNFDNMELIRPLYLVHEEDIIAWRNYSGLKALDCACTVTQAPESSQRRQIKDLIKQMKEDNPNVEMSIFRSGENVAADAVLGYTKDGERHSFLERFKD